MKKIFLAILFIFLLCPVFVSAEQIDINTATIAQLDTLAGIGQVYAQRIIDSRPYSSVDGLDRVKGIGPATLQKIKTQGLACVNCSPSPAATAEQSQTSTPAPTPTPVPAPTPILAITYPSGVFINEILPNPKGADGTDEWIELNNTNNFDVDLSGWQIQDTVGTITTYTIPVGVKILANGFLVFKRPDTKIMLNNDGDGLNLLTPDSKTIDTVSYVKAPLGQSYNKTSSGWQWSLTPTSGAKNIINVAAKTLPTSATPKALQAGLPTTKNSANNKVVDSGLADLSQNINQDDTTTNPWFLFFIVLVITIILAVVILLIKFRVHRNEREPRPLS